MNGFTPKLTLKITNSFKKDYLLCEKRKKNIKLLNEVVDKLLRQEKLAESFKDHKLKGGKFKNCRECHLEPDWLLVYKIKKDELILELLYTGTHSDLF